MKYLIVMPRLVGNVGEGYAFPLGIAYVSASMKKAGFDVETINLNHVDEEIKEIIPKLIKDKNIDVVLTGGQSFLYSVINEITLCVKNFNSNIKTIVGGGIITADPQVAMKALKNVDYGIIGEGEETIVDLCNCIEKKKDLNNVFGIIYKMNNDEYIITNKRNEIEDIDSLPWPDYEGFDFQYYIDKIAPSYITGNKKNSLFMLTSRSCPFKCTFCFHTTGQKYRQRSLDAVFEELEYLIKKYNIKFIFFVDEMFGVDDDRLAEFCTRMKKYDIPWWSQFRVNDVDKYKIKLLKEARCEVMSFGLESADNRVLKSMRKGITIEQIERALELVYDEGMAIEGCFIFGDIAETYETAINTIDWWKRNKKYKINLGPISVYPGTYLYKYALERNIIKNPVEFLIKNCPQVNVSNMDREEFNNIMNIIMTELKEIKLKIIKPEILDFNNKAGEVSIIGKCELCLSENRWEKIKMFTITSLLCNNCGQRYDMPIPEEMKKIFSKNIKKLIVKHNKIAIWGINDKIFDLISNIDEENLFLVDISNIKQGIKIGEMIINNPSIIKKLNIEVVIIGVPFLYSSIKTQIKSEFSSVNTIIEIVELLNE